MHTFDSEGISPPCVTRVGRSVLHIRVGVLSRAEYILYTTRYSTPYLREDLVCELMVGGGEREAFIILVA